MALTYEYVEEMQPIRRIKCDNEPYLSIIIDKNQTGYLRIRQGENPAVCVHASHINDFIAALNDIKLRGKNNF